MTNQGALPPRTPSTATVIAVGATIGLLLGAGVIALLANVNDSPAGSYRSAPSARTTTLFGADPDTAAPDRAASLAAMDPCALLSDDQVVELGYAVQEQMTAEVRGCMYSAQHDGDTLTISFAEWGLSALHPVVMDAVTAGPAVGRDSIRIQAAGAPRCTVVLAVGETQSVSVQAVRPGRQSSAACERADAVAIIVAPALP
jgi:hypothetical protein